MSTRRKLAFATWSRPQEPCIYGRLVLDATQGLAYVDHLRRTTGQKVTMTHLVGKAFAMGVRQLPDLNGRMVLGRFVPHPTVDVSFLVAMEDGDDIAQTKVPRADERPLHEIASDIREHALKLRARKDAAFERSNRSVSRLPLWLVRPILSLTGFLSGELGLSLPSLGVKPFPFGSFIVSNVASFDLDEAYAPLAHFSRVPLLILVGAVRDRPAAVNGKLVVQPQVTVTATLDHRYADGSQAGKLVRVVRSVVENPWQLEKPEAGAPKLAAGGPPM